MKRLIDYSSRFRIEKGNMISFFGLVSSGKNLKNGKISYEVPFTSNGLGGELFYYLTYSYKSLDAIGILKTIEGKLNYQ